MGTPPQGRGPSVVATVKRAAYSLHIEKPPATREKAGNPPGIGFGFHPSQRQAEFASQSKGGNKILLCVHDHILAQAAG
jgi:hypothetical protein